MTDDSRPRAIPLSRRSIPPAWVKRKLTEGQIEKIKPWALWFLMLDHVDLTPAERLVLIRLWFFATDGKDLDGDTAYDAWPSVPTLARRLSLSESAVRAALRRCEQLGLIRCRGNVNEHGATTSNVYSLCWPATEPGERRDRLARFESWCLGEKVDGGRCHRPAGWGTDHAGDGLCRYHDPKHPRQKLSPPRQDQSGVPTEGEGGPPTRTVATPRQKLSPSTPVSTSPSELTNEYDERGLRIIHSERAV